MREKTIELIYEVAKEQDGFVQLENYLSKIGIEEINKNIIEFGVIPENFAHDSSEEKLWAKFSDMLLSKALSHLGIKSSVLGARGNSADVYGETETYTIVGDAKTFRLSRTAKNPKDFKVDALDSWRKENNYSVLVSPLIQYPPKTSQIYSQAIAKNVTLLSYTHLHFLLDFRTKNMNLQPLWEVGNILREKNEISTSANVYWREIDKTVSTILRQDNFKLIEYKQCEIDATKKLGNEGIEFWRKKIEGIKSLTKEEAVALLIKSEKIEAKIKTIQETIDYKIN